ncbi:uncharacterized protein LOC123317848 [Coccinella septempunctata]|uniref:uncharacterized protein LOC123317848 n=1 Tax=Coccinella septempunctata TaxID=41139 RepID=UPI001D0811C3|nr:uncharacterized protein LOC123317848 [Coccinella septempunctata]
MYRQINVEPSQRKLQLILWRSDPSSPLQTYELNTVTYGTAPAAYLSTRCLKKISDETLTKNPKISQIIANDFYVDDLLTGGDSIEEVAYIKTEITQILEYYGFQLRKFLSNRSEIMGSLCDDNTLSIGESNKSKTLGLLWNSTEDYLLYSIAIPDKVICTKRSILSIISQIFDPLGLISPVIITAKIIVQKLWASNTGWDETVTPEIYTIWKAFCHQLSDLNKLKIPRQVTSEFAIEFELHCFSDASESAYGTCIYLRSKTNSLGYQTRLLCAKTRVAPLKTVTIARLELCAALLQAELAEKVRNSLKLNLSKCYYWSDSTITLSWIRASPHLFKIFVANRISQIQSLTEPSDWHYVNTKQNPADILSRGIAPADLISSSLWWNGPTFLAMDPCDWPIEHKFDTIKNSDVSLLPERKIKIVSLVVTKTDLGLFERYSSLTKLQRVTAYCLRFIKNLKMKRNNFDRQIGPLGTNELNNALRILIQISQQQEFSADLEHLRKHKQLSSKSKLLRLTPFLDEQNILRFNTIICQIEACLNSRPISPLPSTPNDLQPLTPSHFLIGARLTSLPEEDLTEVPVNRLKMYKRQQQIQQNFWKRWSKEYISELQYRTKWNKTSAEQLCPGVLVLIKEDGLPPLVWKMGVVEEVHPGEDGVVRAATIRTSTGRLQRPTKKLCPFPDEDLVLKPTGCQEGRHVPYIHERGNAAAQTNSGNAVIIANDEKRKKRTSSE